MIEPRKSAWWARLLVSLGAGLAVGLLVALVLTLVDLYLSGQGYRSLSAPFVNAPALGVHVSMADVLFLIAVALGGVITWRNTIRDT
jgi:Mg/Co/Ni transporter MgtE